MGRRQLRWLARTVNSERILTAILKEPLARIRPRCQRGPDGKPRKGRHQPDLVTAQSRTQTGTSVAFEDDPPTNLDLFEATSRVLVQQAGDQRLIWQALGERALLNSLQILARQPDVQPPILAERGLRVARVPGALALAALRGLPFATLDRLEQVLFVSVHLHRRTPHRGIGSCLPARDDRLQEDRVLIFDEGDEVYVVLAPNDEDALAGVTVGVRVFQNVEQVATLDVEDDVLEPDAALRPELRVLRVVPVEVLHRTQGITMCA